MASKAHSSAEMVSGLLDSRGSINVKRTHHIVTSYVHFLHLVLFYSIWKENYYYFFFKLLVVRGNTTNECWCFENRPP